MSERWGKCTRCNGAGKLLEATVQNEKQFIECGSCGATGLSGDVDAWMKRQQKMEEWSRDSDPYARCLENNHGIR